MKKKSRNLNIDLLKCIGIISVVLVHFFLNSGYYYMPMAGKKMFVYTFFQTSLLVCVPIFIIATGYLMKDKKEFNKKYVLNLKRVIIPYLIISLIALLYKHYYLGIKLPIIDNVLKLLDYTLDDYAWYVNMYISLYLIIPFLNILYDGLKDKDKFINLMIIVGSLFYTVNMKYMILPSYFEGLWIIAYYFIGRYFEEKKSLNISIIKSLLIIFISNLMGTIVSYWFSSDAINYIWPKYSPHASLNVMISSIFITNIILKIKMDGWPNIINSLIQKISNLTLHIYLFSYISDSFIYPKLAMYDFEYRFLCFPLICCCSFLCAYVMARCYDIVSNGGNLLISKIRRK